MITYHLPTGGGCVFCTCGHDVPCKYIEPKKWREWQLNNRRVIKDFDDGRCKINDNRTEPQQAGD